MTADKTYRRHSAAPVEPIVVDDDVPAEVEADDDE